MAESVADGLPGTSTFGSLGEELHALLAQRNGFYAFDSALHVFPGSMTDGVLDLFTWNATSTWKGEYGDLTSGCLFFAEDAFGFQFCFKGDWVCTFDAETGKLVQLARTLEEWSTILLSGFREVLGHPLMVAWQQVHGPLVAGARLAPRTPFVLGGTFDVANLYAADQVELMRFRGNLATQIRDLPDGRTVVVKVVP